MLQRILVELKDRDAGKRRRAEGVTDVPRPKALAEAIGAPVGCQAIPETSTPPQASRATPHLPRIPGLPTPRATETVPHLPSPQPTMTTPRALGRPATMPAAPRFRPTG